MTNPQRPDERVDVIEQIDQLAEFLMEHTPVGIYGNMGAVEHAIAHIKQLQADLDEQRARAERAEAEVKRLREAVNDKLDWAYKRHADYMEKYDDMEDAGRTKGAVRAEQQARWTDVAHSRGYRDALLFVKGEMQRHALNEQEPR